MGSKLIVAMAGLFFCVSGLAQVGPAGEINRPTLSIGAGIDYWSGDWGGEIKRVGPAAWMTADLWRGFGINIEGHSMIAGGGAPSPQFKYFVGEGGLIYTYHRWRSLRPYGKAQMGFGSLSFPFVGPPYTHQTEVTWSFGGGVEYRTWKRLWTRADFTYDGFPNFYSPVTGDIHTLNPRGLTVGESYHFH